MLATVKQTQQNFRDSLQQSIGLSESLSSVVVAIVNVAVVLLLGLTIDRLLRWVIRWLVARVVGRFESTKAAPWLEAIQKRLVARRGAHIFAVLIAYWMIPLALDGFPNAIVLIRNLMEGYVVIVIVMAINSLLRAGGDVLVDDNLPSGMSLRFAS